MSGKKKVLVIGADGYLGSNLRTYMAGKGYDVVSTGLVAVPGDNIQALDILNSDDTARLVKKVRPDVIMHVAGLSSLDACEKNPAVARGINVTGTQHVVDAIRGIGGGCKLMFMSSDYVFDGVRGDYAEDDELHPATVYGQTKRDAEAVIRNNLNSYIICRSANIFGRGGNFFSFLQKRLAGNQATEVYSDRYYTPTFIDYYLDSIEKLVAANYNGIIHLAGKEKVSRYEFGTKLAIAMGKDAGLIKPVISPTASLLASDSSLNTSRLQGLLGNHNPDIDKSFRYLSGDLIRPYLFHRDGRGLIQGILQGTAWREANYVKSVRGTVRGNHYHRTTLEYFFIIEGKVGILLEDIETGTKKEMVVGPGDAFVVNPRVIHTFTILEDASWINMLSAPMNEENKDIVSVKRPLSP